MVKAIITFYIGGEFVETTRFFSAHWTDFAISEFIRNDAKSMGADSYAVRVER